MTSGAKQGLYKRKTLTDADLAEIQQLASICTNHDQIDLRINWDALKWRTGDKANDFLYFRDDMLIGFFSMDGLGSDEAEGTGMVHPNFRRQGVFRTLAGAAQEECRSNGTPNLILLFDRRSQAALAFVTAIGAQHDFSEHNMRLASAEAIPRVEQRLEFRRATPGDTQALAAILAEDSQMNPERLRQNIARNMQSEWYQYYIATLAQHPIGTLNVQTIDGQAYIYGFVVRSEQRGRGYGKEILARAIEDLAAEHPQPIYLEVETNNTPAFALYRSFGFEVVTTYDYYRLSASDE
jgi:ribosomal protein S18 acetylase RimI-like enzyme